MTGTPTLVCRRSGEVAAVGPEFCHLTGWKRDVLLGRAPNLNLNTGGSDGPGPPQRSGATTPRPPAPAAGARHPPPPPATSGPAAAATAAAAAPGDPDRPQPVFLAELLDDDSAVEFYEDFARLAFGDARGNVRTRYRLLTYRTAAAPAGDDDGGGGGDAAGARAKRKATGAPPAPPARDRNETAVAELGDKDGKIDCCCCWTVKRDLFNLPMM